MSRVVRKIKETRHNWWEGLKFFCRLRGYKYYKPPKELKYRYPAPGSVPHTQEDKPHLYKLDYKTPFRDSQFNIREKPLESGVFENERHWSEFEGWDESNPYEKARADYPRLTKFIDTQGVCLEKELFMLGEEEQVEALWEDFQEKIDQDPLMRKYYTQWNEQYLDDVYEPTFMLFHERLTSGLDNDKRFQ